MSHTVQGGGVVSPPGAWQDDGLDPSLPKANDPQSERLAALRPAERVSEAEPADEAD